MSECEDSIETRQAPSPSLDTRMDSSLTPAEDLDVDTTDSDRDASAGTNNSDEVQTDGRVSKWQVKLMIQLTYDLPGQPSNKPVVVVHRDIRISIIAESNETNISCFTVYLNQAAPGKGWIGLKLKE